MASRHRKLLNESDVDPVLAKFCESDCNDYGNPYGYCSSDCINYCPSVCKFSMIEVPQPPPAVIQSTPSEKSHRLSLLLTVSLAVLAAAFFLLTCYTIYRLYSNWRTSRRRRRLEDDAGPDDLLEDDLGPTVDHPIWYIRTVGLQPSVIGEITIVRYNKSEGLIDGTDCSVCLNEFQENETLRLLPKCNHAFHVPCVDTWLRSHTNCPLCRAGIMSNPAVLSSQAQNSQIQGPNMVDEGQQGLSRRTNRTTDVVELESESSDSRVGMESRDDTVFRAKNGPKATEGLLDGIQPMKRSISVDSLSCMANAFPIRNFDNRLLVESKESTLGVVGFNRSLFRLLGNRLNERSAPAQTGFSSMKRSLSCNGNVPVSRHGSINPN